MERENFAKEFDMDSQGVVEVIAKEVDDERRRKQQQKIVVAAAGAGDRSTGPVDRPQYQSFGRPARSTDVHNMHRVRERCKYPTLC